MLTLYIGAQKVEWADAGRALAADGIDWDEVVIRDETGAVRWRVEAVEQEPEPLIVDDRC